MKYPWKKAIVLVLSVAMVLTILAGCGQTTQPATTTTITTEATSTTVESTATPTPSDPKLINFPYTGPEVTFKYLWIDVGQGAEITDSMIVAKAIQEKIGNIKLDLELLPWSDYVTKQQLYLTSGEVPDIMVVNDVLTVIRQYGANGILLDWTPLIEKYMPNVKQYQEKYLSYKLLTNDVGNIYAMPMDLNTEDWPMEGWFANTKLLDKHGIAIPKTKDEFLKALEALKAAEPDIIPFNNIWNLDYLRQAMSCMWDYTDDTMQWNREAQKWEFGPTKANSNFKSYLQFLNTLWTEKLINPEIQTATDEQKWAQIGEGNWGFTYFYFGIFQDGWGSKGIDIKTLDFTAEPILCPTGDNGTAYAVITVPYDGSPYWGLCTSVNCKEPELLAQMYNLMFSSEMTDLRQWGIKDTTYTVNADGSKQYTPIVKIPINQSGTSMADLGFGKHPLGRTFGVGDLNAQKIQAYDQIGLIGVKQTIDALNSGILKPKYARATPTLTQEESEKVASILTPVNTYLSESINKFIMGDMSFDQWDEFITNLKSLGDIDYVVSLYNSKPIVQYNGTWERK